MESVASSPWISLRSSAVKFCVRITPYMYPARQMYIQGCLFQRFGVYIPENIRFLLQNGDVFEGQYVILKDCFIGLKKLLRRYRKNNISFLCFEFIGHGDFVVAVISSTAMEVEYPLDVVTKCRKPVHYSSIPNDHRFNKSELFTLDDHLNENLFNLKATDNSGFRINVYMPHQYYEQIKEGVVLKGVDERITRTWVNFGYVYFKVLDKWWKVQVRRIVSKWYLVKGWSKFASETGVRQSDLVVLSMSNVIVYFDVAIFRDNACTPLSSDAEWPQQFLKLINERMIKTGEILIPRLFRSKYDHELVREVKIVMANGLMYPGQFFKNQDKLTGLGPFFGGSHLEVGFSLIFLKLSESRMFVSIYDRDLVHIRM